MGIQYNGAVKHLCSGGTCIQQRAHCDRHDPQWLLVQHMVCDLPALLFSWNFTLWLLGNSFVPFIRSSCYKHKHSDTETWSWQVRKRTCSFTLKPGGGTGCPLLNPELERENQHLQIMWLGELCLNSVRSAHRPLQPLNCSGLRTGCRQGPQLLTRGRLAVQYNEVLFKKQGCCTTYHLITNFQHPKSCSIAFEIKSVTRCVSLSHQSHCFETLLYIDLFIIYIFLFRPHWICTVQYVDWIITH